MSVPASLSLSQSTPEVSGGESAAPIAPGRADDLIASLADQQIDDMMSEADGGARDAGVP